MKKVIASAGLLALGAVGIQSAHADMNAGTDKPWTISGTLRGFYDDNYNTLPDNTAGRKGSFGFEVRPSGSVHWSDGPTTVSASYTYAMQYYADRPGNKIDQTHDFQLALNHNFNERYTLGLTESFVSSQEPEVLDATLSGSLRDNGDNYHNAAAASFSAQVTRLLGFVLSYANDWWDYTGKAPGGAGAADYGVVLNRMQHLVTLDSRWSIFPETTAVLGYQFGAIDYDSGGDLNGPASLTHVSPSTRNSYSHYIYVGADHNFRSDLTASFRVGAQIMDYYNDNTGSGANTVSPYAQANVNYNYMDGGNVGLGFNYSHNPTDQAVSMTGTGVTLDQESATIFATVSQVLKPISPNLTASLTGQYQNSTFNGGQQLDGKTDDFYLFGFNLNYQFNHYLSTEVGYNYDLLSSQVNDRGYNRNRVYIGVTATY